MEPAWGLSEPPIFLHCGFFASCRLCLSLSEHRLTICCKFACNRLPASMRSRLFTLCATWRTPLHQALYVLHAEWHHQQRRRPHCVRQGKHLVMCLEGLFYMLFAKIHQQTEAKLWHGTHEHVPHELGELCKYPRRPPHAHTQPPPPTHAHKHTHARKCTHVHRHRCTRSRACWSPKQTIPQDPQQTIKEWKASTTFDYEVSWEPMPHIHFDGYERVAFGVGFHYACGDGAQNACV